MNKIVFLLEEPSMKTLLEGMLPRMFPETQFQFVAYKGKSALEKSIPHKLRDWREPGVRFVIIRDNDGGDCIALKERLTRLCAAGGRDDSLVRIVCQELEAWYLGDTYALAQAFGNERLASIGRRARFRNPDDMPKPSDALKELIPNFHKADAAELMATHISRERNISPSFQALLTGIDRLISGCAA